MTTEIDDILAGLNLDPEEINAIRGTEYDEPESEKTVDRELGLAEDLKIRRRATKRRHQELLQVSNAAKHIEQMPEPGESLHCIVKGNYAAWDIVPATIKLEDSPILELHVATLGFNKAIVVALEALLDEKQIRRARIICSHYFQNLDAEIFDQMAESLARYGQRIIALRTHAKIILMRLSGQRHYVIESSANLRSCRNIEQFVMTNDRRLWQFHRDWMEAIFGESSVVKTDYDSARAED